MFCFSANTYVLLDKLAHELKPITCNGVFCLSAITTVTQANDLNPRESSELMYNLFIFTIYMVKLFITKQTT